MDKQERLQKVNDDIKLVKVDVPNSMLNPYEFIDLELKHLLPLKIYSQLKFYGRI